ncbi:DUF1569 domain-containing protein [Spirosoma panaciterrae]|uniref:DUF1569 domain-containing protein n=1 Tax=Spirosoma panaciterrae TaxID=496058 RepID=UPI00039CEF7B|nr:DUF1569 domain-containing protein [Spirosoma panaciterrae]
MKKNLFDPAAVQEIISRVQTLKASDQPKWGRMNATQMVYHCTLANQQIIQQELGYPPSSWKQHLLRYLCLYVLPQFPQNKKGASSIETAHLDLSPAQFDEKRSAYIDAIRRFSAQQNLRLTHPAFGRLSAKEWGCATWMHMDHHLRQFGV